MPLSPCLSDHFESCRLVAGASNGFAQNKKEGRSKRLMTGSTGSGVTWNELVGLMTVVHLY